MTNINNSHFHLNNHLIKKCAKKGKKNKKGGLKHCTICRKTGHNRRTCPSKNDPIQIQKNAKQITHISCGKSDIENDTMTDIK